MENKQFFVKNKFDGEKVQQKQILVYLALSFTVKKK